MIQGNATLVVDLGNSSTKAKVMFGKDGSGKFRERQFELSNVFALIDPDYEVSPDYDVNTSTILKVDTTINGRQVVGCFCNGELQQKERSLSVIKPSATDLKYNLDSTVLSLRLALLFGMRAVMEIQGVHDYRQLDLTWTVVTLLPPGNLDEGRDPMKALINAVDKVTSTYPEYDFAVNISKAIVLPEGYCAYAGVVFDVGRVFRPEYKYLLEESVLIIDIGAGTTDICLVKDNKLVQNSKYTINQGGNNVYQLVRRALRLKGLQLDDEVVRNGVITGQVKDGSKPVTIVDIVNSAKGEVAQKIVAEVQNFLELTDISARSIGYVLVCGGGSMADSKVPDISPMSEKIVESFRLLSPNSGDIKIPDHTFTRRYPDGDQETVTEPISPRELNLVGAGILAEVL